MSTHKALRRLYQQLSSDTNMTRQRPHHLGADSELAIPMNMPVHPPIYAAAAIPNPLDISVVDLFPRQSCTVEEATARYTLKTGGETRSPTSIAGSSVLGEGQISSTSTPPFRAVLPAGQGHFREMVDNGRKMTLDDSRGLTTIRVRHSEVLLPDYVGTELQAGCDVQWISEGPDCLLASSTNFTVDLWHGYDLALLLRHHVPWCRTTPMTNRGASVKIYPPQRHLLGRQEARRPTATTSASSTLPRSHRRPLDGRTLRRPSCTTIVTGTGTAYVEDYGYHWHWGAPREDVPVYGYKSAFDLDLDGNSFSGR
ncbi:hypothetical protein C8F01DRAFT_1292512 [Mycena amicta]|nr:hypothetical protein C8F01DRAFT_1292512 [Mycena amicta]